MPRTALAVLIALFATAAWTKAQEAPDLFMADVRVEWRRAKERILRAAELMPKDAYAFRPVPSAPTFEQVMERAADQNYVVCGLVESAGAGQKESVSQARMGSVDKARELAESIGYCEKVLAGLTDKKLRDIVTFRVDKRSVHGLVLRALVDLEVYSERLEGYLLLNGLAISTRK